MLYILPNSTRPHLSFSLYIYIYFSFHFVVMFQGQEFFEGIFYSLYLFSINGLLTTGGGKIGRGERKKNCKRTRRV